MAADAAFGSAAGPSAAAPPGDRAPWRTEARVTRRGKMELAGKLGSEQERRRGKAKPSRRDK